MTRPNISPRHLTAKARRRDTAHLYGAGIPCCLYGPAGEYDEKTADRYTPVSQIIDCARVLAATVAEVCA